MSKYTKRDLREAANICRYIASMDTVGDEDVAIGEIFPQIGDWSNCLAVSAWCAAFAARDGDYDWRAYYAEAAQLLDEGWEL